MPLFSVTGPVPKPAPVLARNGTRIDHYATTEGVGAAEGQGAVAGLGQAVAAAVIADRAADGQGPGVDGHGTVVRQGHRPGAQVQVIVRAGIGEVAGPGRRGSHQRRVVWHRACALQRRAVVADNPPLIVSEPVPRALALFSVIVPALSVLTPVKVLAPLRVSVPVPALVMP